MNPRPIWPTAACAALLGCHHPAPPAAPAAVVEPAPPTSVPAPTPEPPPLPVIALAPLPGCTVQPDQILDAPTIVGSLDDQAVREAVYQQLDQIGTCIQPAVRYDLLEPGQGVVRLAIAPAGRVSSVELASDSTGGDPEVRGCLEEAFADLVFPRASTVTWVCYPINVAY